MANTSGVYNSQTLDNDELITECFERIGISGEELVPVKMNSARRSLNLLLTDWISKTTNLWTLRTDYLSLKANQLQYKLANTVNDVLQVNLRTFIRQNISGVAQTNTTDTYDNGGGGVAVNAFDGDLATACTQTGANGNISWDYGVITPPLPLAPILIQQQIFFVGITSQTTIPYTLVIEAANTVALDNPAEWIPILTIPKQDFLAGTTLWFDILAPIDATAYRVRETGGATLNMQEIYFTNNLLDLKMSAVSRDTYLSFAQKSQIGRPSCYYFDRQTTPILNIWQRPSDIYRVINYSYVNTIQDAGKFYNIADIPAQFFPALTWGLSWMLAIKYNPSMAADFEQKYELAYSVASANDTENVTLTIGVDSSKYYDL